MKKNFLLVQEKFFPPSAEKCCKWLKTSTNGKIKEKKKQKWWKKHGCQKSGKNGKVLELHEMVRNHVQKWWEIMFSHEGGGGPSVSQQQHSFDDDMVTQISRFASRSARLRNWWLTIGVEKDIKFPIGFDHLGKVKHCNEPHSSTHSVLAAFAEKWGQTLWRTKTALPYRWNASSPCRWCHGKRRSLPSPSSFLINKKPNKLTWEHRPMRRPSLFATWFVVTIFVVSVHNVKGIWWSNGNDKVFFYFFIYLFF